jgi:hypothetical protein
MNRRTDDSLSSSFMRQLKYMIDAKTTVNDGGGKDDFCDPLKNREQTS